MKAKNRTTPTFTIFVLTAFVLSLFYFQMRIVPPVRADQVIIDTTPSVYDYLDYNHVLNAGQVINVYISVLINGPVLISIWNDNTMEILWDSDDIYNASIDLTVPSDGTYIFGIVNHGEDYSFAQVHMIVTIKIPKTSSSISCSTSSSSITSGNNITVSGSISPSHTAAVTLTYTRPNSIQVTRTVTATAGSYADTYVPDVVGGWTVNASWAGDADHFGATSSTVSFAVEASKTSSSISCSTSTSSITSGGSITVSGSISPYTGVTVTLTYTRPNSTLVTRTVTAGAGSYTDTYTPDSTGAWNVKASWAGDANHTGATSSTASFTVKAPSSVSCSVSQTSVTIGQAATVSGSITPARSGIAITLTYTRPDGTPITRTVTTTTGGLFSYSDSYTPDKAGSWKVKSSWQGNENYDESESSLVTFSVAKLPSSITCSASSDKIEKGKSISVSGSISPSHNGVAVTLTYQKSDGSTVTRTVTSKADGIFEDSYTPKNSGSWTITASWIGDSDHETSTSSPMAFKVEEKSSVMPLVLGVIAGIALVGVAAFLFMRRRG